MKKNSSKIKEDKNQETELVDLTTIYENEKEEDFLLEKEDNIIEEILELTEIYVEKEVLKEIKPIIDKKEISKEVEPIIIKLENKDLRIDEKKIEEILYGIVRRQFFNKISKNIDTTIERILIREIEEMEKVLTEL